MICINKSRDFFGKIKEGRISHGVLTTRSSKKSFRKFLLGVISKVCVEFLLLFPKKILIAIELFSITRSEIRKEFFQEIKYSGISSAEISPRIQSQVSPYRLLRYSNKKSGILAEISSEILKLFF